jgi:membrane protease YdiL (CAAX protease family)
MAETILFLFLPFIILTILANLGNRHEPARVLTYLGLAVLNLGLMVIGGGMILANTLGRQAAPEITSALGEVNWTAAGIVVVLTGLVAFLPLLPPLRRGLARLIPIDPDACVHATALVFALYLTGSSVATLWLIPTLAASPQPVNLTPAALWTQELVFGLIGALGVGLFTRRNLRGTVERLKLGGLSAGPLLGAAGVTVGLIALSWLVSAAWNQFDPKSYTEVGRISELLFGNLTSPIGVLTLGLAAGIGEEILFRGALQPRLGLPLTAFLFMIAHTQYTISPALAEIFVVGWVLGVVRDRSNTSVCILIHAAYNILNVVLAPLFP